MGLFIFVIYIWVNICLLMVFKLSELPYKLSDKLILPIAIAFPFIGISILIEYINLNKEGVIKTMTNKNNNVKKSINKKFETAVDKAAIRFINLVDRVRGTYEH